MSALKTDWVDSAKIGGPEVRADLQHGWHAWVGSLCHQRSILDVGAGIGMSRERMSTFGNTIALQDIAPGLAVDYRIPVSEFEMSSFDVVTCFDVLEHVVDDVQFVNDLVRISRRWVVITTPNYAISKAWNPHHCREYTGEEFLALLSPYHVQSLWGGNSTGTERALLSRTEFREHRWPSHAVILEIEAL